MYLKSLAIDITLAEHAEISDTSVNGMCMWTCVGYKCKMFN